ncbi:MAG: serine/threonine-protein kinase, partial [Solirubrobacterales bacterium]
MSELGIGSEIAGYRIDGVLGRGGMGVVYRATDERLGRSAAVKVIAPDRAADDTFRRRFLEESRAAAAIDHPNVLPVYAAGEEDGTLFLVTRLVDGPDLARLLGKEGALDPERALAICDQVGSALDAAHARGLTHRDVKPANVLVTEELASGAELCYLTDFGLAQRVDRQTRLTSADQLVGTLDYIAPEQIQGGAVDGRADLYALGALFYECVTGAPPFLRDSHSALLYAHLHHPPPPISEQPGGAPAALDPVVARALAKPPEDRFASGAEFIAAARGALSGDRPGAHPAAPKTVVSASGAAAADPVAAGSG